MLEIELNPPSEEYRYLHTSMELKITLWDRVKILFGLNPLLGFCVRLVATKGEDSALQDIDVDFYSTKVLIKGEGSLIKTREAIFDYEKLHAKEGAK